jgi:hypothetical protein
MYHNLKQQQKLLISGAKLKTLENTKSAANLPKHVFGVFYDVSTLGRGHRDSFLRLLSNFFSLKNIF